MDEPHPLFDRSTAAGRLMAATDWAATPVGSPDGWPESLRGLVRTVLSSRYPMLLLWGEEFTQLYNDAYSELIGEQHPAAMGDDCRVTLAEGWPVLGPIIGEAMATGVASWVPALQLLLERSGYREEAYFSVSHAPARDDEGVTRGVLTVCSEVTEQVVGQRRLQLLRDLSLSDDRTLSLQDTAARLVATVAADTLDVPFAALYLREGGRLRRAAAAGAELPAEVGLDEDEPWGLRTAAAGATALVRVPEAARTSGGAFADPVVEALALPVPSGDPRAPLGVLVAAVAPSRALDEPGRSFYGLLAQQAGVALRNARAYEEERARAEALAELDRVKTSFFTGVSHEFRTPLTLMLGPLSDAAADEAAPLPPVQRERVETALRSSQRLLKLVNDLLTFSSLEAGGAVTAVRAVDLAALTTDVASSFRAAVERAGLTLDVDCPPLPRPVRVDPEHWEVVVTNLLSNALKFTFTGGIAVQLTGAGDEVRLEVADTGVGVPADELPRLFDRFSRVVGARARSHEGSGIGLALVRELTALHAGTVEATSEVGVGSRFCVRLPWRPADGAEEDGAPVDGTTASSVRSAAVAEATAWTEPVAAPPASAPAGAARVLVADDNADMRAHLVRLLRDQGWAVEAVADGQAALASALREPPDLLLTDVMMPGLDGFELVRALRADPRTATLPVVVLSARAGEGASAEGLDVGADDYVVKPFVSSDLVARLRGTLRLARQRSAHVQQLGVLADAVALITSGRRLDDALRTVPEQVRVLLGARGVRVRVVGADAADALVYSAGLPDVPTGEDPRGTEVLEVPVRGRRDRELGSLTVRLPVAQAMRPETRALLAPLGRVLAAVVEEGWHAQRDVTLAATLQAFLLPERLPELAGLELAAAYRPAEQEVQVGGDWYDVLPLPDGRVAISTGDVAGQGLTSALVMGQLRTAVRAYALEGRSPAEAVTALDDLVDRLPGASFATLFLGYLDVGTGLLTWCSAGHPPPALLPDDGPAHWIEGEVTPPLGAGSGLPPSSTSTPVPAGARLVLYTDGLVEDRQGQLDDGMPALLRRLDASRERDAAGLVAAVLDGSPTHRADDTAVLVVHRRRLDGPQHTVLHDVSAQVTVPSTPRAASLVRRRLAPLLRQAGVDDDVAFSLLVALSEAVNNAVEHAVDPVRPEVIVTLQVRAAERTAQVDVQDSGHWRERRPSMDRGHGATLMQAGGQVQVHPGDGGTRVTLTRPL